MAERDDRIELFLAADKKIGRRVRWLTKSRADYAEAIASVVVPSGPRWIRGKLIIVAHRIVEPPKYGFSLLFRGERVLALDVNPRRSHRNILTGKKVTETHWQRYPLMEAEADDRELSFAQWANEFLLLARITPSYRIASPPTGEQLELELKPWRR